MGRFSKYFFILVLSQTLMWQAEARQEVEASALKSVWLAHFSKFIEWPNITDTTDSFVICVIGEDGFQGYLDQMYSSRKIKDLAVKIDYIQSVDSIGHCHMLFISENMRSEVPRIIEKVKDKPILTIADEEGLAEQGVMINFYQEGNQLAFEINLSSSENSQLDMSFRLLELAKIVKKKP